MVSRYIFLENEHGNAPQSSGVDIHVHQSTFDVDSALCTTSTEKPGHTSC